MGQTVVWGGGILVQPCAQIFHRSACSQICGFHIGRLRGVHQVASAIELEIAVGVRLRVAEGHTAVRRHALGAADEEKTGGMLR